MSKANNEVIIIGRIGSEPTMTKTKHGMEQCKFRLSNSTVRDGLEDVQWHNIVVLGKQAKLVMENIHKGDLVCIEGVLVAEERTNEDGEKTYNNSGEKTYNNSIVSKRIVFLSSRKQQPETGVA